MVNINRAEMYTQETRSCRRCKEEKSHNNDNYRAVEEIRSGKPYAYVKTICRDCETRDRGVARRKNRDRDNARRRRNASYGKYKNENLKKHYGITLEQFEAMSQAQDNKCGICLQEVNEIHKSGRQMPLTVDHCHSTGKVRGLLCGGCNRGLGDFKDNIDFLKAAIKYLEVITVENPSGIVFSVPKSEPNLQSTTLFKGGVS